MESPQVKMTDSRANMTDSESKRLGPPSNPRGCRVKIAKMLFQHERGFKLYTRQKRRMVYPQRKLDESTGTRFRDISEQQSFGIQLGMGDHPGSPVSMPRIPMSMLPWFLRTVI